MDEYIRNFRQRRDNRLRQRGFKFDDDEENENGGGAKAKVSHGNTRLPYGIAKQEGIDTTGMSPRDVWEALSGKGYSPKGAYGGLKEGKRGADLKDKKEEPVKKTRTKKVTDEQYKEAKKISRDWGHYIEEHESQIAKMKKENDDSSKSLEYANECKKYQDGISLQEVKKRYSEIFDKLKSHDKVDDKEYKEFQMADYIIMSPNTDIKERIWDLKHKIKDNEEKIKIISEKRDKLQAYKDKKDAIIKAYEEQHK